MAESSSHAPHQRRANWVALRTVRQRPKLVDHTTGGMPVYEIRSVRLVLVGDAAHFNRLVPCSKCGADVPGPPVLSGADLDRPSHSVICKDCVRASGVSQPSHAAPPAAPRPEPPPEIEVVIAPDTPVPSPQSTEADPAPEPVAVPVVDDARLAAIEDQLRAALLRITELADVQRLESIRRTKGDEAVQAQAQAALGQGLAELRAEVMASAEATAARVAALEASLRGTVDQVRVELARMSTSTEELAARVSAQAASTSAAIEAVHGQLGSLDVAIEERARQEVAAISPLIDDLTGARHRVAAEVDRLVHHAAATDARIDALTSSADMGVSRLHALEQRMQDAVHRLAREIEAQRRSLQGRALTPPSGDVPPPVEPATAAEGGSADLMDALERQLRKAESRLSSLDDLR